MDDATGPVLPPDVLEWPAPVRRDSVPGATLGIARGLQFLVLHELPLPFLSVGFASDCVTIPPGEASYSSE